MEISINEYIIIKRVENIVAGKEIAHIEQFLFLQQSLQKPSAAKLAFSFNRVILTSQITDQILSKLVSFVIYCFIRYKPTFSPLANKFSTPFNNYTFIYRVFQNMC